MEFHLCTYCALLTLTLAFVPAVSSWQNEWRPNYQSRVPESRSSNEVFEGLVAEDDNFKLLLAEGDTAFVGSRNRVYYMSLKDTKNISTLVWEPDQVSARTCNMKGKTECQNYIRVLMRKSGRQLYICGTNAFQPKCRHYNLKKNGQFTMGRKKGEGGTGVCPFDPFHNSTSLYTNGTLYAATVTDSGARYPLIIQKNGNGHLIRTRLRDSMMLNDPNFVSSFDKDDKVLFFFRETAIENINCGKAVFSRVARVCKTDKGGSRRMTNTFTSFFKARLNCSIPGQYPFYFNEIQATSDFGQGNYRPTKKSGDRSNMIYGIFNTPENSIRGSAVCAYRYSDITNVFRGRFKGQRSIEHNWLPVRWEPTPTPHPEQCSNNTREFSQDTIGFIQKYPLMDEAVQPQGHAPMLVFTSFTSRFTQIAIDWQIHAADGHYYDVMFVGTDDGRIIKSINKGSGTAIESVIIEDLQVLESDDSVSSLKVLSDRADTRLQKLVVISRRKIVSIPLHRCGRAKTCSACVGLQDPYCVWNAAMEQCISAESGIQSIETGKHESCKPDSEEVETPVTSAPVEPVKCSCPQSNNNGNTAHGGSSEQGNGDEETGTNTHHNIQGEGVIGASKSVQMAGTKVEIVVVAVIVSIIASLIIGFFIGYKVQSCRYNRDVFSDSSTLQRGRNRLSSGDNPYFHTSLAPKKMNYVVNVKNTKSNTVETKPVTKSNKVYL